MREGPSNSDSQAQARGLGAGAIASLTGVGLLLIFMLQNTESVRLDFLFWGFTWPLWLLTLASAFLGALVWFGLGVMRRHRRRKERREDRRGLTRCGDRLAHHMAPRERQIPQAGPPAPRSSSRATACR
jgi:uncharacterized integral membrane protein